MRLLDVLVDLVLGLAVVVLVVGVADEVRSTPVELGQVRYGSLDDRTRERLAALEDKVFVTYFVSARERMPSNMRRLERRVTDLLEAMKVASDGRLDYQIVDPDTDPDLVRFASRRKVSPIRVRHVMRDSYSEQEVWSTLTIAYGPRTPAMIEGVGPGHLPRLQALLVEHLDAMEDPPRPKFGVAAPARFGKLRRALAERGEVVDVDLSADAPLPDGLDVLFWMDAIAVTPDRLVELDRFLDGGGHIVVAGSSLDGRLSGEADWQFLELEPTRFVGPTLLGHFGLRPVPGLLLDERSMPLVWGSGEDELRVAAPFRVTCIAPNQDFHTTRLEPNGTFLFVLPTTFVIDGEALSERGWSAEVLATSSDETWIVSDPEDAIPLKDMEPRRDQLVAKQPLVVWLRPDDRWRGTVVALASSSPFRDELYDIAGVAHPRLLRCLVDTLASVDRLVTAGADIHQPDVVPELPAGQRLGWRLFAVLALPALLGVVAAIRNVRGGDGRSGARRSAVRWRGPVTARAALGLVAVAVVVTLLFGRWDLTSDGLNRLHPRTVELASSARGEGAVDVEMFVSDRARLPPALRPQVRRLEDTLADLARAGAELDVQRVRPEDLSEEERAALVEQGITPFKASSRDEEVTTVRTVWSTLRLTSGDRSEVLAFDDAAAYHNLEFRLAFALWRLQTGRRPHVAMATDSPRLSAAEAHQYYQTQGLMAPQGKDVYSLARAVVASCDFRVTHVNPRDPELPEDVDAVVWLQPRRPSTLMLAELIEHLYRGGRALVAAQHFNIQSRQYRGAGFEFVYWPQPQSPDLELYYFPEIGIHMVREVLFDESAFRLDMESQVNRTSRREFARMESARPFNLRAVAANFSPESTITADLGDQAFPWAAFLRWDEARLEQLGITVRPLITTTEHTWTLDWHGGWLPPELLEGPPPIEQKDSPWTGTLTLAAEFEGRFPWPQAAFGRTGFGLGPNDAPGEGQEVPPYPRPEPVGEGAPGRLVFVACSELFKDGRLAELASKGFRSDELLLNAVADLTLDDGLAALMARRPVARGFDPVDDETRAWWRAVVPAAAPMLFVLLGVVRFLWNRRPPRIAVGLGG